MRNYGRRLGRSFYARDPVTLARDLLGRILLYESPQGLVGGRIVETEAYTGETDPASHAFRGRSARNAVMFDKPGLAYVYFSYGMHHCLNVTADRVGVAGAVLLRALEPVQGIEVMQQTGVNGPLERLLSGPGKICKAFGLSLKDNGRDLVEGPLRIASGREVPAAEVSVSPRIGISRAVTLPYRFFVSSSPSVSGPRRALKAG